LSSPYCCRVFVQVCKKSKVTSVKASCWGCWLEIQEVSKQERHLIICLFINLTATDCAWTLLKLWRLVARTRGQSERGPIQGLRWAVEQGHRADYCLSLPVTLKLRTSSCQWGYFRCNRFTPPTSRRIRVICWVKLRGVISYMPLFSTCSEHNNEVISENTLIISSKFCISEVKCVFLLVEGKR
jgi:hypothetical protein